ncbi:nucleoside-diphosphate sugar epimerase/dehydratase [uncultured Corynebacterium sp.]|uniref:nucleoside-diphosphate sugar epimerase/dehydratase n=1 Tax=uncultured Corynebacterium sp. TaxID=159447 RepID=UPI0025FF4F4E|nr:nucleoside-diphosphate sugar epimerase/dehydratase [uncultured Corynebacterium sp.]
MIVAWDVICWLAAIILVAVLRFNLEFNSENTNGVVVYGVAAIVTYLGLGLATNVLNHRYKVASFEEALALAGLTVVSAIVGWVVVALVMGIFAVPPAMAVAVPPMTAIFLVSGRGFSRALRTLARESAGDRDPIIIIGAGDAGSALGHSLRVHDDAPYRLVGYLDDDPRKCHLRLHGAKVLGKLEDLEHVAAKYEVGTFVLAISNLDPQLVEQEHSRAQAAGVELLTLPPVINRSDGVRSLADRIRKLEVADFLGRPAIDTDLTAMGDYIRGKRVLITGAGGSIGSEIARQVATLAPSGLYLLDRDESALCAVQLDIYGNGLLESDDIILCDIRDPRALADVFDDVRPQVVFHAAALKHLPLLQRFPVEGWRTNVVGTWNVLEQAMAHDVEAFVNISTDKAAEPTSVLGRTKQLAEHLTGYAAGEAASGKYVSVRFGNVLGSRGSMLHTFTAQIERGGPITVTDPEVERYFMTIPEACALVIQAGSFGSSGECMVLDMGEPVKILDVAKRMVSMSGEDIDIVFTGLRPGEKMSEILLNDEELSRRPFHPLVSHVSVPRVDPRAIEERFPSVCELSDRPEIAARAHG